MKTITLTGRLEKKFGKHFEFDISTPGEAIRALCYLFPDFENELRQGAYKVVRIYKNSIQYIDEKTVNFTLGNASGLRIEPVVAGAKDGGIGKIILGVALVGAAFFFSGGALAGSAFSLFGTSVTYGQIALTGALIAVSGAAQMLASNTSMNSDNVAEANSFLIDAPQNRTEQGHPVPLAYGRTHAGSVMVSVGISSEDFTDSTQDNTLLSRSTLRIIDVVSEGPIKGLVNGDKSILFNETQFQNSDGTYNFTGIEYDYRLGTPTQTYVSGFPAAENEISVGVQVKHATPFVRDITDPLADAILLKIKVPQLRTVNSDTGDIYANTVELAFDIMSSGGSYVEVGTMTISGKTSSAYERAKRLELPTGGAPWTLRVRRVSVDSSNETLYMNQSYVSSYTILYDVKLQYPNSALFAYKINAQLFGSNSPSRVVHIDGIISQVPTNYDPETRVYTGIWDGSFKYAWHNNPVWVLWDIMVNDRYGLGDIIQAANIDKFGLYTISQYCDELVSNGEGALEPRFSFNGVIGSKQEAVRVLDTIAAAFRGMIYWSNGAVMFTQDRPGTPRKLVSHANVIDGDFSYSGTALKARHTAALVSWNDPADLGRAAVELVQRDDLIQTLGYHETQVAAYGTTSRGQAQRVGEWLLDTEEHETETVTYRAALDHADLRPGELIYVADPAYTGARYGGRVVSATTTAVTVDSSPVVTIGETYALSITLDTGEIQTRDVLSIVGNVVTVSTAFTAAPVANSMWIIAASNATPRTFRVISNVEKSDNTYEITALFHDPTKYARIERNQQISAPDYIITKSGKLEKPENLAVTEYYRLTGVNPIASLIASWTGPNDNRVTGYEYQIWNEVDQNWKPVIATSTVAFDDGPIIQGVYKFRVRSTAIFFDSSEFVEFSGGVLGPSQPIGDVSGFAIANLGQQSALTWDKITTSNLSHYEVRFTPLLTGQTWANSQVLQGNVSRDLQSINVLSQVGTYLIKAVSFGGVYSENAVLCTSEIATSDATTTALQFNEHTGWAGTFDRTEIVSGSLRLKHLVGSTVNYEPEGYYYFSNSFDAGGIIQSNLTIETHYTGFSSGATMSTWLTLSSVARLSYQTDNFIVRPEYRTSVDGGVTWSTWQQNAYGIKNFRNIQFRLYLASTEQISTPSVNYENVRIDVTNRTASNYNVACTSAGLRVNFAPAFLDTPSVHIDGQGLNTGDYHRVTSKDNTGFNVTFYNSAGTAKAATFDWIATGYGFKS